MSKCVSALALLLVLVSWPWLAVPNNASASSEEAWITAGREIAKAHCTRCHVVGDINPLGGISSTPSFQLMVNELDDWLERFETFFARRPHPAVIRFEDVDYSEADPPSTVPIVLKVEDVEALVRFAESLKKKAE